MIPEKIRRTAKRLIALLPNPKKIEKANLILLGISFVVAVFLWAYLASTLLDDYDVMFQRVPLVSDLTDTQAAANGLQLLSESADALADITVDCSVHGSRTVYGGLKKSDVVAYVDYSAASDVAGQQTLPILLRTVKGAELPNASISPDHVTVEMDHFISKKLPVSTVDYPNLTPDDETVIDRDAIVCDPDTVTVSGPSALLSKMDHASVEITDAGTLSETTIFSNVSACKIMDAEGHQITTDSRDVTIDKQRFSATIPVYYLHSMAATVTIVGSDVPEALAKEVRERIRLRTSEEYVLPVYDENGKILDDSNTLKIRIKTTDPKKKAVLDEMSDFPICNIPLNEISIGMEREQPIRLSDSEGYELYGNIDKVTIVLDDSDLESRTFWFPNSEIEQLRKKQQYDYQLAQPNGSTAVTLTGTKEALDSITENDIKLSVDMLSLSPENIDPVTVNVTLPEDAGTVWVSPQPTLQLSISHT